jgi:hypothetical protein
VSTSRTTASAREHIASVLGEPTRNTSFSVRRTAPASSLKLEIKGLGQLPLPVPEAIAEELCRISRPARFGRGERTLLDRSVRDTFEVPKSRLKIDRSWLKTLQPLLAEFSSELGLAPGTELDAELHSMLVYSKGQFFLPHQDSEKDDDMIGSLVVTLPSSFSGGTLVVRHREQTATYRSSKNEVSLVAFYADCRHEIKPVKSGYRVAVTYNLVLRGEAPRHSELVNASAVDALVAHLHEHFNTPQCASASGAPTVDPPNRLVYLLDHEYTQRSLSWTRLKGQDVKSAALLRAAADRAECDIALSLAEIHETWDCFETDWRGRSYGGRRYGRWEGWDDDSDWDEADGTDDYELGDLLDATISIDGALDVAGRNSEPLAGQVDDGEACWSTPSGDLTPYTVEYEGYQGNYGNTVDRWYRRAAIMLWPRDRAFAVHSEASAAWALEELGRLLKKREVSEARSRCATLAPFWTVVARDDQTRGCFKKALRVARHLDDPKLATMLLVPWRIEAVSHVDAPAVAALVDAYGDEWAAELLHRWSSQDRWTVASAGEARRGWVVSLPRISAALVNCGDSGVMAARLMVRHAWSWLSEAIRSGLAIGSPSRRDEILRELGRPIAAVLSSCLIVDAPDVSSDIVEVLRQDTGELIGCQMAILRDVAQQDPAVKHGAMPIVRHCASRLQAIAAQPERQGDDWSIAPPTGCACELCEKLSRWLGDRDQRTLEWPLAKDRRAHVHSRIDAAELPVRHLTRRVGRPFSLVLTKTDKLFQLERDRRSSATVDLTWLRSRFDGVGTGLGGDRPSGLEL